MDVEIANKEAKTHAITVKNRLPIMAGKTPPSAPNGIPLGLPNINSTFID